MAIVIDASIVGAWVYPDESDGIANAAAKVLQDDVGLVPGLFWFEVRNLLLVGERRKRISIEATMAFLSRLDQLPLLVDTGCDSGRVMDLARRRSLTAYDAAYLETAERHGVKLATLDRKLAAAASATGVDLLG
ncbi:MAG: type II toxin-antitoxin system VapC family toxin [Geminicoccaceae bacterium]